MAEKPKGKGGRPSKFDDDKVKQAEKLCELGATDEEIAAFFEVDVRTIYRWKKESDAFCQALKAGKAAADDRVERSLYNRAVGYTYESEKLFQYDGVVVRADTKTHVPPDVTAQIFWLKNRRKDAWRDRQEVGHDVTEDLAAVLEKARKRARGAESS